MDFAQLSKYFPAKCQTNYPWCVYLQKIFPWLYVVVWCVIQPDCHCLHQNENDHLKELTVLRDMWRRTLSLGSLTADLCKFALALSVTTSFQQFWFSAFCFLLLNSCQRERERERVWKALRGVALEIAEWASIARRNLDIDITRRHHLEAWKPQNKRTHRTHSWMPILFWCYQQLTVERVSKLKGLVEW